MAAPFFICEAIPNLTILSERCPLEGVSFGIVIKMKRLLKRVLTANMNLSRIAALKNTP